MDRQAHLIWRLLPLLMLGCAEKPIEPARANPFVQSFRVTRVDSGEPVGDEIEIAVNTGFTVEIAFSAAPDAPQELEGRPVQPPGEWPVRLVIYPRDHERSDDGTLWYPCNRFEVPNRPYVRPVFPGVSEHWKPSGYTGPPKPPRDSGENKNRFWTYFAVPRDSPGEYVFEVLVYPTSAWKSLVRVDAGPPVVLQRGVLRVRSAGNE